MLRAAPGGVATRGPEWVGVGEANRSERVPGKVPRGEGNSQNCGDVIWLAKNRKKGKSKSGEGSGESRFAVLIYAHRMMAMARCAQNISSSP